MPSARPAAVAIGNERKSPTSAAARAASTSEVMAVTCKVMIGTTRMPATAAMAEPSAQFWMAILLGDRPIAAADRSLSDTASVASPKRLLRYISQSSPADTEAMANRISRSTVIATSPHRVTRSVGSQLSTWRALEP